MRKLLKSLKAHDADSAGRSDITLNLGEGEYRFITYGDGTMAVRHPRSLMSPQFKINQSGLKAAMAWIDEN